MTVRPIFADATTRPMNIIVFGSGKGTNAQALVVAQKTCSAYFRIQAFFVNKECAMEKWGKENQIPVLRLDQSAFKRPKFDRESYYSVVVEKLNAFIEESGGFDVLVLAGWDSIVPPSFLEYCKQKRIVGLNIHPADLSITDEAGQRKYVGSSPGCVAKALGDGVPMRSTVHIVEEGVDAGPIVVLGPIVPVPPDQAMDTASVAQFQEEKIKPESDWPALKQAVLEISKGWKLGDPIVKMSPQLQAT